MALHLDQRCRVQPRPIRLVAPESCAQVQDPSHYREIAIDRARTDTRFEPGGYEGLQCAVMNAAHRQLPDVWVQCRQPTCIPFQAALVLVFLQILRCRLPERMVWASAKELDRPCRLQSAHQERLGFLEIACASAFANALSVDDFVDVPDSAS